MMQQARTHVGHHARASELRTSPDAQNTKAVPPRCTSRDSEGGRRNGATASDGDGLAP
jgi:hypothetical protein